MLVRAPELVEAVVRLGAPRGRIMVTSSGVREESLGDFDGGGFREAHGIRGSPVVLFMGRLNPLKGPQHLVEAAPGLLARFPDAQFVFIGPDQAGYGDALRSRTESLGVSTHVHFLGPIYDFQEKMAAYASCDAFALPTSFEGTSQSIFEAMAQARPVVATNAGGVPSQLTDGQEGFLVPVGDHRALGDRLATVLADSAAAAEMGRKGKARVRAKTYPALATELEAIYAEARAAA